MPGYTNPQNLNRYSYVRNNPLRYTDPTGHQLCGDGETVDCGGTLNTPTGNAGNCSGSACQGNDGDNNEDDEDSDDDNSPIPDLPDYDLITSYCGQTSFLGCVSYLLQDGAIMVDAFGMGEVSAFTAIGCVAGTLGGGPGLLAGCAAGAGEGLFLYNIGGPNAAESALSIGSTFFTVLDDVRQYGELGESSKNSITTTLVGLVMVDPFTDAVIDVYASGYNHGLFNGIDNLLSGQPILAP